MPNKVFYLFFALILLLGGFLRFYKLGEIPAGTYWDETAMIVDARSLAETGMDMHGNTWFQAIFPSYGDYKLPVYIWCATLFVKVLGPTALAVRMPSAIAGILNIILTGLLARQLAPKKSTLLNKQSLQLLSMMAMALAFWDIMFSRAGFEGHLGQLLLGFSVYLGLKAQKRLWFLPLSGLLGFLALFTYYSTRFVWPVVFLFVLFINLNRVGKQNLNKKYFVSLALACLMALAIFAFGLKIMSQSPHYQASQQFRLSSRSILDPSYSVVTANQFREITSNATIDRVFFHRYWFTLKELVKNYSQHLNFNFLFVTGDSNLRHGTGNHGLFALSFLPILFVGVFTLAKNNRSTLIILVVWWLLGLLPASVPLDVPHSLRSLNSLIPICLILGFGLSAFWQKFYKRGKFLLLAWFVWTVFLLAEFFFYLVKVYPQTSAVFWQSGYTELAQALLPEIDKNNKIWVNINDGRFYLWLLSSNWFETKTIQSWLKNNFQLNQVANIVFSDFIFDGFQLQKGKFILAGERSKILASLNSYGITYTYLNSVIDKTGTERFVLVYFN